RNGGLKASHWLKHRLLGFSFGRHFGWSFSIPQIFFASQRLCGETICRRKGKFFIGERLPVPAGFPYLSYRWTRRALVLPSWRRSSGWQWFSWRLPFASSGTLLRP